MEEVKNILVCIDKAETAGGILHYTSGISRVAESRNVHLLHVQPPESESLLDAETAPPPIDPEVLRQLAAEHFKGHGSETITCKTVAGAPLVEILRYELENDIDLIVLGRERGEGHPAVLTRRIARKATCSVLVFPEGAETHARQILVPVRDSECSAKAVEAACRVAGITGGTVCCLNVFAVRSGYLKVGATLEEHTLLMRKWAERESRALLQRIDTGRAKVVSKCEPDFYARPVPIIMKAIEHEKADLVVIGARGRTGAAGVLLGMVTEQLIQQSPVPILAVKKKGECLGILQALLTLSG